MALRRFPALISVDEDLPQAGPLWDPIAFLPEGEVGLDLLVGDLALIGQSAGHHRELPDQRELDGGVAAIQPLRQGLAVQDLLPHVTLQRALQLLRGGRPVPGPHPLGAHVRDIGVRDHHPRPVRLRDRGPQRQEEQSRHQESQEGHM